MRNKKYKKIKSYIYKIQIQENILKIDCYMNNILTKNNQYI